MLKISSRFGYVITMVGKPNLDDDLIKITKPQKFSKVKKYNN